MRSQKNTKANQKDIKVAHATSVLWHYGLRPYFWLSVQSKSCCILEMFCLPTSLGVYLLLPSLLVPLHTLIQCDFIMSFSYFKAVEVCVAAWKMLETSANIFHVFLELVLDPRSCSSWNTLIQVAIPGQQLQIKLKIWCAWGWFLSAHMKGVLYCIGTVSSCSTCISLIYVTHF